MVSPMDFELNEATLASLQFAMSSGERTARSITKLYLDRIGRLNEQGPELRAVIETNPDALTIAEGLDDERAANGPRGPLHGMPVVLKDNIDTSDAMATTAGSLALEGSIASSDAYIVTRLRAAGAVVLAKANMSEWAYFRGAAATSGWSARGGQCRNPYALDRNPCGSSSGSAVAVAANLAAAAIGTETSGSIMCPSSINGVVGIKPTVGLWSRSGIIPISHSQDTAGPMCRTVADAATLLSALVGVDHRDPTTETSAERGALDYTAFLDPAGLRGARIGIARNFDGFHRQIDQLFEAAIEVMRRSGAYIIDPASIEMVSWTDEQPLTVLEYEFKDGVNRYLAQATQAAVSNLDELIAFNESHAERELTHFGQERLLAAADRGSLDDVTYTQALAHVQRSMRSEGIDAVMDEHHLDALIAPTADLAWPIDHIKGDPPDGGSSAGPAAIAGYPNVTVPMGFVRGLPSGISFMGRAWSEATLIRLAYGFEQATKHRTAPTFAPSLG